MYVQEDISPAVTEEPPKQQPQIHRDDPPSYTPPGQDPHPENKKNATTRPSTLASPPASVAVPEHIHSPTGPFLKDLYKIGSKPANVICPSCQYGVRTYTKGRVGSHAGVWATICCVTCGIIAAIIPLVMPSCQDVEHICSNCGFRMAKYRRGIGVAKVYPPAPRAAPEYSQVSSASPDFRSPEPGTPESTAKN